jgi:hypothetical protein
LNNSKKVGALPQRSLSLFILLWITFFSFSQENDSTTAAGHFGGAITVTNNGISFIPNFTLGKPAVIFDMSAGKGKLSFEPQFRFALEGKPWSILFWWRYKILNTDKFQVNFGAHPALSFKTVNIMIDSVPKEKITADRYIAGEITPYYFPVKNIGVGINYFYGHCLEQNLPKNTHMLSFRVSFSNIRISDQFFFRFLPQVYYLRIDKDDGFYVSSFLTFARRNFPLSISSVINKAIETDIPAGKDFLWNVSLIYSFNREYIEK